MAVSGRVTFVLAVAGVDFIVTSPRCVGYLPNKMHAASIGALAFQQAWTGCSRREIDRLPTSDQRTANRILINKPSGQTAPGECPLGNLAARFGRKPRLAGFPAEAPVGGGCRDNSGTA